MSQTWTEKVVQKKEMKLNPETDQSNWALPEFCLLCWAQTPLQGAPQARVPAAGTSL